MCARNRGSEKQGYHTSPAAPPRLHIDVSNRPVTGTRRLALHGNSARPRKDMFRPLNATASTLE
eukprot:15446553-Alexandrium_andersonii.AAC.1